MTWHSDHNVIDSAVSYSCYHLEGLAKILSIEQYVPGRVGKNPLYCTWKGWLKSLILYSTWNGWLKSLKLYLEGLAKIPDIMPGRVGLKSLTLYLKGSAKIPAIIHGRVG